MDVKVDCYAGYRGEETPRRFEIDGALARAADDVRGLEDFRQKLIGEILAAAKPD